LDTPSETTPTQHRHKRSADDYERRASSSHRRWREPSPHRRRKEEPRRRKSDDVGRDTSPHRRRKEEAKRRKSDDGGAGAEKEAELRKLALAKLKAVTATKTTTIAQPEPQVVVVPAQSQEGELGVEGGDINSDAVAAQPVPQVVAPAESKEGELGGDGGDVNSDGVEPDAELSDHLETLDVMPSPLQPRKKGVAVEAGPATPRIAGQDAPLALDPSTDRLVPFGADAETPPPRVQINVNRPVGRSDEGLAKVGVSASGTVVAMRVFLPPQLRRKR